jgi:hypothetical protein
MTGILEAMEIDQGMRILCADQIVRKMRLIYDEIVDDVLGDAARSRP